ncbi:probable Ufm1-specific protease 1 isoform X2 [Uloborus diversus]|uniref:probable Ufm1-specific protease 1 isoform X2 n=1 Tax=Uloborus diversus TaxID=327109 RepID=UPI0024097088|nr:probable Ufm1-specific protease 1 isoform X2 [Uloborus diversus]
MNVFKDLDLPPCVVDLGRFRGNAKYYHYCIDGVNDQGWGCGYRTLQTILSWIKNQTHDSKLAEIPSIKDIQRALVQLGDKTESFVGSKTWIGSIEVAYCLDFFHQVGMLTVLLNVY